MLGGDTTKGERGGSNGSSSSSSSGDVGIVISKQQQQQQPRNNRNNNNNNNKSNKNKNKNNNNNKNSTILRSTNNNNNKKNKKGSRSSHNNHHHSKNKIIIRPYNKPPTLPINYYEDTVNDILIGTTEVLKVSLQLRRRQQQQQQRRQQEQEQEQSSSGGVLGSSSSFSILNMTSTISSVTSTSSNSDEGVGGTPTGSPGTPAAGTSGMSLQNSYNAVTNLVNHRHGSRLYKDLISSLRNATHIVLPSLTEKTMLLLLSSSKKKKKKDNHNNNNNDRMIDDDDDDDDKDDDHPNANAEEQEEEEEDLPLLDEIPTLYRIYTDYLLLCQHVFLPLDRTHAYDAINDTVVSTRGNGGGTASSGNSGNSGATVVTQQSSQHQHQQSIWHVGLSLWYERLKTLHYDSKLYQQWLNAFFLDWNGNSNNNNYYHSPSHHNYNYNHNTMGGYYDKNQQDETIHMPTTPTGAYNNNNSNDSTSTIIRQQQKQQRQQLKDVWYMWQDLGLLSQLPLQHDLETYWTNISQQWTCCGDADGTTATNTTATTNDIQQQQQNSSSLSLFPTKEFLQFCTDKHIRCTIWSQWLPVQWLRSILDVFLVKPHLLLLSTDATTTTTTTTSAATMMMTVTTAASAAGGMGSIGSSSSTGGGSTTTKKFKPPVANLLRPENLHPILLEEVSNHSKLSSSLMVEGTTTTTTTTSISSSSLLLSSTNNTNNNTTTTTNTTNTISPIQQLWMLAGRIHGGHTAVATAIASFVRIQGLQRVVHHNYTTSTGNCGGGGKQQQQVTTAKSTTTTTTTTTASSSPTLMIQELLQFQDAVYGMIRSLPNPTQYGLYGTGGIVHGVPHPATEQQQHQQQQQHHQIQLKNVWEEIVNTDVTPSVAECLAKFFDLILRSNKKMDQYRHAFSQSSSSWIQQRRSNLTAGAGGGGGIIDTTSMIDISSPDQWLQSILTGLFVPLQSKDIFEAFYRRDLAKRLLWNRITSIDIEKSICSLLKAECGTGYTSKMEGMFQDIEYSRETMNVYKQINNNNNNINQSSSSSSPVADTAAAATATTATASSSSSENHVDMEVQVLTTGYWPVYPKYPNLILPDSLCIPRDQFATHYKTKYQGRRMTWQYALGHCIVKCNGFKKKPYFELVVSLCQALVLLQFQTSTSRYTITQLMTMVGLDDRNEMERILQSLSLAKEGTRILRKIDHQDTTTTTTTTNNNSNSKKSKVRMSVHDNDIFCIDDDFHSNKNRIRINNIMMKETKEERDKTVDAISRDRLYLIDAVLVRIMKARKTILHHILIPQVLEQMKIPAQTTDIKKRIESLIEREYMERDDKDRNRYNYLA